MLAISILFRTRYACHIFKIQNQFPAKPFPVKSDWRKLCAIKKNKSYGPIRLDRKRACLIGNGFSVLKIWQTFPVPIRKDGRNTWSLTKLIWQACLVPFVINKASIPSPSYRLGWFTGFRFFLGTVAWVCLICALI